MTIIAAEKKRRDEKTARLRAAREAAEKVVKEQGIKASRARGKVRP
ncbi:hypothetical protein [Taklimakanibacter deserti]